MVRNYLELGGLTNHLKQTIKQKKERERRTHNTMNIQVPTTYPKLNLSLLFWSVTPLYPNHF
jgi:hypothetical protein